MTFNNEETTPVVEEHASDVVTEKKFSELTNEDLKGMNQEEVENYAKGQGWQSAENFRGDPRKVKTAMQFINDGKNELPIIRANNKKLADSNDQLRKDMANSTKTLMAKMERQDARHKKELERGIKEAESKIAKATVDFDVVTATQETENKVVMQNELDVMENDTKQIQAQTQQTEQQKVKEWETWRGGVEANELLRQDPVKFMGFERMVGETYMQNKDLPTSEIIQLAKDKAYSKASAPNIQGANSSKSKPSSPSISREDRDWINSNITNETQMMKNRGASNDEIKAYTKKQTKHYESKLEEEQ